MNQPQSSFTKPLNKFNMPDSRGHTMLEDRGTATTGKNISRFQTMNKKNEKDSRFT